MYKKIVSFVLVLSVVAVNLGFLGTHEALAASLTALSDTVSDLTTGVTASHTIKFTTPTGIAAGKTVILTFNNGTSTAGVTAADVTVLDGVSPITVNAGAPTTTNWGFVNASPVITFTTGTGTVAAGHVITITFNGTNKITNGSAGTSSLTISGNFGDTGVISMAIVSNGVVAVSAQVLPTLSFTVSGNAIYYGQLRTAGICFAQPTDPGAVTCPTVAEAEAFNMTASTNGATGYTITVQGATLTSGANTIAALASNTASAPGTEQFGIRINHTGVGTGTVSSPYAAAGYAYTGTATTPAPVASALVATLTDTYSVRYMANISPVTKAGSYTTSHTYVATGNF